MPHPQLNPAEAKLKKQLHNQRYHANSTAREHNKEYDKLYHRKRREQMRLGLHQDPLAQLADTVTQQEYLRDASEVPIIPKLIEEQEPIDGGIMVEEDGEILENFAGPLIREWDGGFDGGFYEEPEPNGNDGFDGRFPDEQESDTNDDFGDGFNGPEAYDDGSQILIPC